MIEEQKHLGPNVAVQLNLEKCFVHQGKMVVVEQNAKRFLARVRQMGELPVLLAGQLRRLLKAWLERVGHSECRPELLALLGSQLGFHHLLKVVGEVSLTQHRPEHESRVRRSCSFDGRMTLFVKKTLLFDQMLGL